MNYNDDKRIVLTLDAGGTNFFFSAIQGNKEVVESIKKQSFGSDLDKCLNNIIQGFEEIQAKLEQPASAISFAFPGPADYPNGIIDDLENLPGFRGGVALGPMLKEKFNLPVFINNDGNLFALGEAIAGFLPHVNKLLKSGGSNKQYHNLFGITIGTGFGGGIISNGRMMIGDNSAAGEIWAMRGKIDPNNTAEEGISIRAVKRTYAQKTGTLVENCPEPVDLFSIVKGELAGNKDAALQTFDQLGENVGDALANAITLVDGLMVIGGGIANASELFLPRVVAELNSQIGKVQRLEVKAFNLEDKDQLDLFIRGEKREIKIPGSDKTMNYDPLQRVGVGISKLGTEKAVCIGAYVYALKKLDNLL